MPLPGWNSVGARPPRDATGRHSANRPRGLPLALGWAWWRRPLQSETSHRKDCSRGNASPPPMGSFRPPQAETRLTRPSATSRKLFCLSKIGPLTIVVRVTRTRLRRHLKLEQSQFYRLRLPKAVANRRLERPSGEIIGTNSATIRHSRFPLDADHIVHRLSKPNTIRSWIWK